MMASSTGLKADYLQIHRYVEPKEVNMFVEKVFGKYEDLIHGFCTSM